MTRCSKCNCKLLNPYVFCRKCELSMPMCAICGCPGSKLIRLTWKDLSDEFTFKMEIMVAKHPKSNDSIVCEDCIRGIKRLPFSDFADIEVPF